MRKQTKMTKNNGGTFLRLLLVLISVATLLVESASPALSQGGSGSLPTPDDVQTVARRANDYWIANRPGPEDNNWSRSTYFTGNMAHYQMTGDLQYLDNAWKWAETDFNWQLNGGCTTVFAENHTVGQIYLALYEIDPQRANLDCLLDSMETSSSWGWLEVDLGSTTNINRLTLDTFQDRAYSYLVDVKSNSSDPYTMVLDRSDANQDESTIASTLARFVRLRVIGAVGYNGQRVSLDEFGIFGESDPNTNLALNRPIVCSSEAEPENNCAKAVDGDVTTAWSAIVANDFTIESPKWWWVDALYVAMPVYATLSNLEMARALQDKLGYSSVLYSKYNETKEEHGLYDTSEGLWYRDSRYLSQRSPNDQKIFWSRGNGWAFAALARVLEILPTSDPHYQEYLSTFQAMADALRDKQEAAGYWNQNLTDANQCGGPESSGTAFFAYGLAWGINNWHLDRVKFLPTTTSAWQWLANTAIQNDPDGLLGYVQPVGHEPICDTNTPLPGPDETADFGVGAFLLAASEVYKLSTIDVNDSTLHMPQITR